MNKYIKLFDMQKHIEGGYFKEVYQSADMVIPQDHRYANGKAVLRKAGSSIYFLLEQDDYSAWHRIKSDEIWHYYDGGSAVQIYMINDDHTFDMKLLGRPDQNKDAHFQIVIPAGTWFAADLTDKNSFALMGCTVSPGFEYDDFELADKSRYLGQGTVDTELLERFFRR